MADMTAFDGRIRPFKAARAFFKLMKNKEDSAQVVHFRTALDGDWHMPMAARVKADPEGARILERGTWLFDTLNDIDYLTSLPEGSLGRVYYETTLLKGFTPQGFRDQDVKGQDFSLLPPEAAFVHYRLIDMHDLLHTVTGYGRDGMGEICILEFQGVQFRSRGLRLLSYAAVTEVWKRYRDTPALKCVHEAHRVAKNASWMAVADWEALLPRPLEEVQAMLGLESPERYLAIYDLWQARDEEMRAELAAAAAERRPQQHRHNRRLLIRLRPPSTELTAINTINVISTAPIGLSLHGWLQYEFSVQLGRKWGGSRIIQ